MSTESAQRRLLEALANMHDAPQGRTLAAFALGLREMSTATRDEQTLPGVAGMYAALADLAEAVRIDLTSKENSR